MSRQAVINSLAPLARRGLTPHLLALIAGASLPFAFAPYHQYWLVFLCMAGLFALVRKESGGRSFRLGYLFGLGLFASGTHWIYYSVHLFGNATALLAALMTVLWVVALALFPAFACWAYSRIRNERTGPGMQAALFTACWVGVELLRGWLFGGFPWLSLGYSQTQALFGALAPVVGVFGISLVLVLISSLIVVLMIARRRTTLLLAIGPCVLLVILALVVQPAEWSLPRDTTLKVRLVQGNIEQSLKFSRDRLMNSLDLYLRYSAEAPADTNVIIWPETAIPTRLQRVEQAMEPFVQEMASRNVDVLTGVFYQDDEDKVYNAFKHLGSPGAPYRKHHLVPFGEFMPFRSLLDFVSKFVIIPMSDLSRGPYPATPLPVQGEYLGVSICYEDVFGEEMRHLLPMSTVLVNVSNDAWFGSSAAPWQHQQIAAMRARELSRPLLRVTNTGVSSFIDHRGVVQEFLGADIEGALDVEVVPRSGITPYVTLGNWPVIVVIVWILLLQLLFQRHSRSVVD